VKDIDRLIAQKEAAIAQLKDEIKALKRARRIVEGVSGASKAGGRPGRKSKAGGLKKTARARRGAKKAGVFAVLTAKPQRMRDIAEKAGVSTPEAASVLQSAVRRGEVKKGRQRGTYRLPK
jgi:hypothetical protein